MLLVHYSKLHTLFSSLYTTVLNIIGTPDVSNNSDLSFYIIPTTFEIISSSFLSTSLVIRYEERFREKRSLDIRHRVYELHKTQKLWLCEVLYILFRDPERRISTFGSFCYLQIPSTILKSRDKCCLQFVYFRTTFVSVATLRYDSLRGTCFIWYQNREWTRLVEFRFLLEGKNCCLSG